MMKILLTTIGLTLLLACSAKTTSIANLGQNLAPTDKQAGLETSMENQEFLTLSHLKKNNADLKIVHGWAKALKSKSCQKNEVCELLPQRVSRADKRKQKIGRFNFNDTARYQTINLAQNYQLLKPQRVEQLIKHNLSLAKGGCPYNLSAAAIMRLEGRLQTPNAWETIKFLYQKINQCPITAEQEMLHLRVSLLAYGRDDISLAKEAISNALKVSNKEEFSRIFYWAGVILEDDNYLKEVVSQRPYTLHAILAAKKLNLNLWQQFEARTLLTKRLDTRFTNVYEKLLFYQEPQAAFELLNRNLSSKDVLSNPDLLYYYIQLMDRHGRSDFTIRLISRLGQLAPEIFTAQYIKIAYKEMYYPLFRQYAPETDPFLMLSLSKQESGFYTQATSRVKAKGLMQLMPATARHVSKSRAKDIYNVDNNIYLGSTYFQSLFMQFNNVEAALAAYNAGPARVIEWRNNYPQKDLLLFIDLIPFKETRGYVSTILRNNYFYYQITDEKIESKKIQSEIVQNLRR